MRNYQENEVIKSLNEKNDLFVNQGQKLIFTLVESPKGDIGIKTKGKISYLVNYLGYWRTYVSQKDFGIAKKNYR